MNKIITATTTAMKVSVGAHSGAVTAHQLMLGITFSLMSARMQVERTSVRAMVAPVSFIRGGIDICLLPYFRLIYAKRISVLLSCQQTVDEKCEKSLRGESPFLADFGGITIFKFVNFGTGEKFQVV